MLYYTLCRSSIHLVSGPEWDSSDEERAVPALQKKTAVEKETPKKSDVATEKQKKTSSSKNPKKTKPPTSSPKHNKEKQLEEVQEEENLALYIGHLPKEFEERDLISFLSQFGKVLNCRISRKVATGNSKGYAFVRFVNAEVCQIVCDTLHGYFLGRQRLVCQVRPAHRNMFYNTDTVIQRRIQQKQLEKKQRDRNLANLEHLKEITARLMSREAKKRKQLDAMGIEYDFPGYKTNQEAFQVQHMPNDIGTDNEEQDKMLRKRSDSTGSGSEGSDKKTKKNRSESMVSVESAPKRSRKDSVENKTSSTMSKREKPMEGSERSETKQSKKKRKASSSSQGSATRKKNDSDASNFSVEEKMGTATLSERGVIQSAKKTKKVRKDKKGRVST
jgi:nucleolar protein 15